MARKRDYDNDYPSVTTVIDVLRKIGLENWFKINTPEFIKAESSKAKEIGTQLHEAIQAHIELNTLKVDTQYPNEITNALKSFMLFKKECPQIKLKKAEIKLTSEKHKLNGTCDCLCEENNQKGLLDWKSAKRGSDIKPPIYDEASYQVSAYFKLYEEVTKDKLDFAYIVSFAKDDVSYNLRRLERKEVEDNFNNIILPCLQIYFFKRGKK